MARSDDALRRIARERLHVVAQAGDPVPGARTRTPHGGADVDPHDRARHRAPHPFPALDADPLGPWAGPRGDAVPTGGSADRPQPREALGPPVLDGAPEQPGGAAPPGAPAPPGGADDDVRADLRDDVRDVVERMRREALSEAAAQYGARHGHPLDHPGTERPPGGLRWSLTVRHAVVAAVAVVLLTTGVVVRATADRPPAVVATVDVPAEAGAPGPSPVAGAGSVVDGASGGTPDDGRPAADGGPAGPLTPGAPAAGGGAVAVAPGTVVVHVVGQVNAPGVVTLAPGARVEDALRAAGGAGPAAELSAVNLARVVVDGEQIVVPAPGEVVATPSGAASSTPGGDRPGRPAQPDPVDLNVAGTDALDDLPGIGPVLAQRIVDWRTDHGPFRDVEELGDVAGIGQTLLGRLRPLVTV